MKLPENVSESVRRSWESMPVSVRAKRERTFWSHVEKGEGCWVWKAACFAGIGYGVSHFFWEAGPTGAHRVSWTLYHKRDIPIGMHVCHHCDNRQCVRPKHLFLGTAADNLIDCVRKGRYPRQDGENNHARKFSTAQIVAMREYYARGGVTKKEAGNRFGIDGCYAAKIINGRNWKLV